MKMHNTIAVLVGLVILAMPWSAPAVVIFSTYDGTTAQAGGSPINRAYSMMMGWEGQRVAVSFSPGSQSYGITSITVNAVRSSGMSNDFNLGLYDNDSGHPGTLIGYLSNPGGIGSQGNYIFTANSLKVESNTTYWIIGEPSLSTESQFTWCFGTSGTSRGENYLDYEGSAWYTNWRTDFANGSPSVLILGAPVPEPSMLFLVGMFGCSLIARRFRQPL